MLVGIHPFLFVVGHLAAFGLVPPGPGDVMTLKLSRAPAAGESVVVRLSVGVLPAGARVVVQAPDGEIAGTVSPFGVRPGRKAGVHTIPVPAAAVAGDVVTLRLHVQEKGADEGRSPSKGEIEGAELTIRSAPPEKP